jgi:hypothetical protein
VRDTAPPPRIDSRLRGALLLPVCVLAVHQLRYYLAYGSKASAHLAASGHAYLSDVEPFALLCVAIALGALLGRLAAAWLQTPCADGSHRPLVRVWALCAFTLVALYCCQELIEGMFASGHAAGLAGIFGHGGWIAVPSAALIGGVLALTLRAAQRLVGLVAGLRARRRAPRLALTVRPVLAATADRDWRLVPLSGVAGSRAPPLGLSL